MTASRHNPTWNYGGYTWAYAVCTGCNNGVQLSALETLSAPHDDVYSGYPHTSQCTDAKLVLLHPMGVAVAVRFRNSPVYPAWV